MLRVVSNRVFNFWEHGSILCFFIFQSLIRFSFLLFLFIVHCRDRFTLWFFNICVWVNVCVDWAVSLFTTRRRDMRRYYIHILLSMRSMTSHLTFKFHTIYLIKILVFLKFINRFCMKFFARRKKIFVGPTR